MSTRSQIAFYGEKKQKLHAYDALVYRHYDGYPEGVLPDLIPVLMDFDKNRGLSDSEYASAWLVAKWKTDYLNIGISKNLHGDIEYFYAVYPDRLEIYETPFDFSKKTEKKRIEGFNLIKRMEYEHLRDGFGESQDS